MYNQFFGLNKPPFNMTPDPALLFMPPQHREALAGLTYAILNRKGFAVLIGDAGTGKTTLLGRTLQYLQQTTIRSSVILNPTLTAEEFLEMALLGFGISAIPRSKALRLTALQKMLAEEHAAGRVTVLIIDEAHKLSPALLEEVRLLSNFELADQKLLQIVLLGQNELGAVLNDDRLRQLKQRIATRLAIGPLAKGEVEQYIRYRWTKCGGSAALPFPSDAIEAIAAWSNGIPRLINAICDNALTSAFAKGARSVQTSDIMEVARDLDLRRPTVQAVRFEPAGMAAALPGSEIGRVRVLDPRQGEAAHPSLLAKVGRKLGLTGWSREYE